MKVLCGWGRGGNAKCKMQNAKLKGRAFCILHFAFCISAPAIGRNRFAASMMSFMRT
jgi:hypothetical protein